MADGYYTNSKASSKQMFIIPKNRKAHILLRGCHVAPLLYKKAGI